MTRKEFMRTFHAAKVGQWIEYYRGFLWADRGLGNKDLHSLGSAAWGLYKNGEAALVQRRNGDGCEYIAVKL